MALLLPVAWVARRVGRIPGIDRRRQRRRERKERRERARLLRTPSLVGVVRVPNPKRWKVDNVRVMATVTVAAGADRTAATTELAQRAAAGEFDPGR